MPIKLLKFLEQIMMATFLIKLTLFKKTGILSKIIISLRKLTIKFHVRNQKSITFFAPFTFLLFDSRVCFPFNKGNEVKLKRNQKSNREKVNLSLNQF